MSRNMDNFSSDDMVIPELKLIQNIGGESAKAGGAKAGDLFIPVYDQVYPDGLDVVIVDIQKQRTRWSKDIGEGPPECSSSNADMDTANDGTSCKACEHRCDTPWTLDATERRTKCLINYNIMAINIETEVPLVIRASGISVSAVKILFTQLKTNKALNHEYHRGLVHVSSEHRKTAQSDAYALKFKLLGIVADKEQAKRLLVLSSELIGTDMNELLTASPEQKALPEGAPENVEPENPPADLLAERETVTLSAKDIGKGETILPPKPAVARTQVPVSATPNSAAPTTPQTAPRQEVIQAPAKKAEKPKTPLIDIDF
jgi:hypothetical protein